MDQRCAKYRHTAETIVTLEDAGLARTVQERLALAESEGPESLFEQESIEILLPAATSVSPKLRRAQPFGQHPLKSIEAACDARRRSVATYNCRSCLGIQNKQRLAFHWSFE